MNNAAAMMNMKKWLSGSLLALAIAGCSTAGDGDHDSGDRADNSDIQSALAALPEASVLLYSPDGVVPQYIVGDLGKISPSQDAGLVASDTNLRAALPPILKAFRLENKDLFLRKVNVDELGARHYRYAQKFNGLDVVGGDLVVHVDVKGGIFSVNGTARGDIPSSLGASSVTESAANAKIAGDARWAGLQGRTVTGSRMVYIQSQDGSLHKAYEQIVEGLRGQDPVKDRVYVDADTGAVLETHPMIHSAKNRITYSANNGTSLPGTQKRTEGQAATGDAAVDAAHNGAGDTYDAYKLFFNRDSYNNAGATMKSSAHYSTNYCNAFWNSTQMVYGDGDGSGCVNLTAIDVVGHELTHAVTENESGLVYSGESGGLNESLSDIFGSFVESYVDGGRNGTTMPFTSKEWLIGDLTIAPFLRNLCDPNADGSSADVWSSSVGGLDVHYSSGPNNLAYCLLVKGGTHPRGKTTNMVPALGLDKAIRIFYKAQVDIMTSNTNYAAMRTAMENAAVQLGYDAATKDAVSCAYAAIKVGTAPASCGGTPPPPDGVLTNGVPASNISDSAGGWKYWTLDVPSGQSTVTFTISGGTGDADLYVNFGAQPSSTVYQCRPYLGGNAETCTFTPPQAGKYYVGLNAYATYSGVTLTGTYSGGGTQCGGDTVLANSPTGISNLSGATGASSYWCMPAVPSGKTLSIRISGGTGDADLYTRFGSRPTTSTYNCRPYLGGNAETCTATTTSTTAGDWYIMLRGYAAYSGVTLIGSY